MLFGDYSSLLRLGKNLIVLIIDWCMIIVLLFKDLNMD